MKMKPLMLCISIVLYLGIPHIKVYYFELSYGHSIKVQPTHKQPYITAAIPLIIINRKWASDVALVAAAR